MAHMSLNLYFFAVFFWFFGAKKSNYKMGSELMVIQMELQEGAGETHLAKFTKYWVSKIQSWQSNATFTPPRKIRPY